MRAKTVLFLFAFLAVAALSWSSVQAGGSESDSVLEFPLASALELDLARRILLPAITDRIRTIIRPRTTRTGITTRTRMDTMDTYAASVYVQPAPVYVQPCAASAPQQRYYPPFSSAPPTRAAIPAPPPAPPAPAPTLSPPSLAPQAVAPMPP